MNSDLIDGILSLSYNNVSQIPNNNFIVELYKEGKISSPSFSIIITSSNINRLYLGDIMKNDYIKNYVNKSMNKGECEIIDNKWQCKTEYIRYTDFIYSNSGGSSSTKSLVKFDLKEKKLTIPKYYYNFLVVGYRYEYKSGSGKHSSGSFRKRYNKLCYNFNDTIYCTCSSGKNSFGVISLFFKNDSRLDVDLRDYIYYDKSAYLLKCRIDVFLSNENEFIIGLKGLNNTIFSFDLDDKKIEFFHRKKANISSLSIFLTILFFIIIILFEILSKNNRN